MTAATGRAHRSSRARLARYARILILALVIAIGVNHVVWAVAQWPMGDLEVYLAAAERLRGGEPLYQATEPYLAYWYAPWFALAWIPLTYLPHELVAVGWATVLLGATTGVGWVLWRMGTHAARLLAVLTVPALFAVSAGGNVQAIMVLGLIVGMYRRSGPLWVAAAASLKFTPVLFVLVYVARREWGRALVAAGLSTALIVPAFMLGLPLGATGEWSESAPSLLAWGPWVYVAAVGACGVIAILGPVRHAPLAVATGAVLALPRLFVYDVTLIAAGAAVPSRSVRDEESTTR